MRDQPNGSAVSVLRTILPVFGFLLAASTLGPSAWPSWWEVRFHLTAKGDYTVKDSKTTYSGEFLFRAQWEGTMERDGADFLLYYTGTEPQAWEVREKASLPGVIHVLTEKETVEKPRLRLNYILRQGADVLFDFSVGGIKIPLGTSPEKFNLILPRSEQRAGGGDTYSAFVRKGKNQISIDEQDLGKRPLEKSFSWEWKSQQWISREKGVVLVASSHKAAVTVTLIPHD
jgi:hypothetical protein